MNDFTQQRLQAHWAAQIAAAVGATYAEPHPQWHHVALRWDGRHRALVSAPSPGGIRGALRVPDGALVVIQDGKPVDEFHIDGMTFRQGVDWMRGALRRLGLDKQLQVRDPDKMPEHPVAKGVQFDWDPEHADSLARLYAMAAGHLNDWAAEHDAGPVLVWAHHFDLASLWTLEAGTRDDGEDSITVGLGMTPGDETRPDPYWYVTPWPYPDAADLPPLEAGAWNTQGWVGATLDADADDATTATFIRAATDACRVLLQPASA